jgi:probable rRNA maturation factor
MFFTVAEAILGSRYTLSIVLIGDTRSRALNHAHRGKTYAANVLSFPLTPTSGEVFINLAKVRREHGAYQLSEAGHALFLLIHACFHLKGYDHGSRMERAEQKTLERFAIR